MRRRLLRVIVTAIAVVVVAGGVTAIRLASRTPMKTITATFAETPGLYPGNHVDVLSIPVGTITKIQPGPSGVEVTMQVQSSLKVPANATAVLAAPQVVNDRFIELTPAYSGGPTMPAGTHLPMSRTAEPLSVDEILQSLNDLFTALGPTATDNKGLLASLVAQLDSLLGGQGTNLHNTIGSLAAASSDLATDAPGFSQTLSQMSTLIGSLAADAGNYESFTNTFAAVAADLNGDRGDLANALSSLQTTLNQLATFIQANASKFGGTLQNLQQAVTTLASKQQALASALQITPLAVQNLGMAVHPSPTGPVIMGRFDPLGNTLALTNQVCGDVMFRAIRLGQEQQAAPVTDPVCAFGAAAANLKLPPGAGPGPVLTLPDLLAAQAKS
jgi:phospholipid/cholesterol/gamma-HCH transport system substrate-binding protein